MAARADGDLIVAWSSFADGSGSGVLARRFASSGEPLSSSLQVNSYTTDHQSSPAVAADAGGGFVVVWHSDNQDGSSWRVFAQRFGAPMPTTTPTSSVTATATPTPTGTITPMAMPGELYEIPTLSGRALGLLAVLLMAAYVLTLRRQRVRRR